MSRDVIFNEMNIETGERRHVRTLSSDTIKECPHVIIMPEHYREDGSCKCDDPNDPHMAEWEYTWDGSKWE